MPLYSWIKNVILEKSILSILLILSLWNHIYAPGYAYSNVDLQYICKIGRLCVLFWWKKIPVMNQVRNYYSECLKFEYLKYIDRG